MNGGAITTGSLTLSAGTYDNLGGWPNEPTSDFFAGSVDEAAVFTTALSQAQVLASYRAGR